MANTEISFSSGTTYDLGPYQKGCNYSFELHIKDSNNLKSLVLSTIINGEYSSGGLLYKIDDKFGTITKSTSAAGDTSYTSPSAVTPSNPISLVENPRILNIFFNSDIYGKITFVPNAPRFEIAFSPEGAGNTNTYITKGITYEIGSGPCIKDSIPTLFTYKSLSRIGISDDIIVSLSDASKLSSNKVESSMGPDLSQTVFAINSSGGQNYENNVDTVGLVSRFGKFVDSCNTSFSTITWSGSDLLDNSTAGSASNYSGLPLAYDIKLINKFNFCPEREMILSVTGYDRNNLWGAGVLFSGKQIINSPTLPTSKVSINGQSLSSTDIATIQTQITGIKIIVSDDRAGVYTGKIMISINQGGTGFAYDISDSSLSNNANDLGNSYSMTLIPKNGTKFNFIRNIPVTISVTGQDLVGNKKNTIFTFTPMYSCLNVVFNFGGRIQSICFAGNKIYFYPNRAVGATPAVNKGIIFSGDTVKYTPRQ